MWHLTTHRWTGDPKLAIESTLAAHLDWMYEQQTAGRILMAGPTLDRSIGIIVFGHLSAEEVDDVLSTEPFIAGGYRNYESMLWDVHHVLGIGGFSPAAVAAQSGDAAPITKR